ncbi:hypothetical protein CH293_18305 [Rhodococcus sp. 14-2470-1b]|uniref:ABC transporter permease n=1 Tax=Rhodococcus sp. 14-2470-1b TaxID=2023149 RepID=UPI000B9B4B2F|nr:ABC transporter permease subunit [Rhodococcus sp. 14-2470-1b]OZF48853.1 hypothetical protein CH293_18305 [Rhodococcus sp. 14-2470-1b]
MTVLRRPRSTALVGMISVLVVWQLLSLTLLRAGGTVPGPIEIVSQVFDDGLGLYVDNSLVTVGAAAQGYLWGNLCAVALAVVALVVPPFAKPIMQIGVFSYCLPIVAIGPLFAIVFEEGMSRVVLAGMSVFFTTLVGVATGLRAADSASIDVVTAQGGGAWMALRKVRFVSALPALFTGLQIAAPAALLGAIIGEYIGADNGLGVLMISSQQSMQIPRTWAVALAGALIAGVAYVLIGVLARLAVPWSSDLSARAMAASPLDPNRATGTGPKAAARAVSSAIIGVLAVCIVWSGFLAVTGVSSFIGRSPTDVAQFLLDGPATGADTRSDLLPLASQTLRDAVVGLGAGMSAAIVVAALFALSPSVKSAFMGVVLAVRTVPLIAMAPLIVLVVGRGAWSVAVIGGLVTFFPTLVTVLLSLERIPKDAADLMASLHASRWRTFVTVQVPMATSGLISSLRIAAPLAFTGALLAEWLATGDGLGYDMILSMTTARYDMLWAEVVLVTAMTFAVYAAVGILEKLSARMYSGSVATPTAVQVPARKVNA